jgi:hypothetical protein
MVVDGGVDVRLRSIEQSDDTYVDVPDFVRPARANADFWLGRVDAQAGPPPITDHVLTMATSAAVNCARLVRGQEERSLSPQPSPTRRHAG